jgi:hypothetical protein
LPAILLLALGGTHCSYDWTVGASTLDAAEGDASSDASNADASVDRDADVVSDNDAKTIDASRNDASAMDAGTIDADAGCLELEMRADQDRTAARQCMLAAGQCTMKVKDACGCDVFVAIGSSAAAQEFAMTSQELVRIGCALQCSTCPVLPTQGTCLDMMAMTLCYP